MYVYLCLGDPVVVDVETYISSVSSINEKDMVGTVRSAHIRQKSRQELYVCIWEFDEPQTSYFAIDGFCFVVNTQFAALSFSLSLCLFYLFTTNADN